MRLPVTQFAILILALCFLSRCNQDRSMRAPSDSEQMMMRSRPDTIQDSIEGGNRNMNMMRHRMRGMMQQMMSDMLPPGIESEELPERDSHGAQLLIQYCTGCHNLPSPAMHSAGEWPVITARMFRRMEMMRGMMKSNVPSPDEQKTIVSYLKEHSMRTVTEDQFRTENSEGARLFLQTCSQCHALPDPTLHTPQEWETVVERMRGHMETMGKNEITDREKERIVEFLKNQSK